MNFQRRDVLLGALGAAGLHAASGLVPAHALVPRGRPSARLEDFDFDTGNAVRDVIYGGSNILMDPIASMDVPVVLRVTHLSQNAWFDAVAPYHPTAVGIHSRLGRRPASESATNRNKNIALLYAAFRVLESLLPPVIEERRELMRTLGLDPDDRQENTETPIGLGNLAARHVLEARLRDGMNQLGDEGGRRYNPQPYADYTGYLPVNPPHELRDPSRWQPEVGPHLRRIGDGPHDLGAYVAQRFNLPQMRLTTPYAIGDPGDFRVPPPSDSDHTRPEAYRRQVDASLAASAELTDEQKLKAEVFDNKFLGLGRSVEACAYHHELDLDGWIQLCMTASTATFDATIVVWSEKHRYDSVRPFSAIRHVYGDDPVTAWGGPGAGTVSDIPASQWRAYLKVGDHPEYPSGSTALYAAQAQAARRFVGSDELAYTHVVAEGGSLVEPGVTPARETELRWDTWTDFVRDGGLSRVWGGVHFMAAVEASWELGPRIGDLAYEFVRRHIEGEA